MNDKIRLKILGTQREKDTFLDDWPAEVYDIGGALRGGEQVPQVEDLEPDAVLELELANGSRILVPAEDAGRYLGESAARGDQEAALEVGQALRFSTTHLPEGLSRDGLGAWLIKGLRIYRQGPAAMTALAAAGAYQDAQLDDRNGLYRCDFSPFRLHPVESLPQIDKPILLFIHGTASCTEGSFSSLWNNPQNRKLLTATYGQRIYAFEHRSLTESPVANALALVQALPENARLHVVGYSRGGMVGELLARANRRDSDPFTATDIEHFEEHSKRVDRRLHEEDKQRLQQLNRELVKRRPQVERFVRVGCPARGTTLASGRLDRWASVMLNLLGKGFDAVGNVIPGAVPVIRGYHLLKRFLLAVVKTRENAAILPGLEAMMPDSALVALLNAPDVEISEPLHVLAGDYQGEGLLPWLGDCLSEVFYGGATDLVVNTPSMSGGAARAAGIYLKRLRGPGVTHFSYFQRPESAEPLLQALLGDSGAYTRLEAPSREQISRGGRKPMPRPDAPIVFILPGIMGSHIEQGRNRIWFEPLSMVLGEMDRLKVDARGRSVEADVQSDGWLDISYQALARFMSESHEVRPFAYDWRLSIADAAERFGKELDQAMKDAAQRNKPVRIIAHSMGGLVARLALKERWPKFKSLPGSRLLQLGTPNRGSHSMAAVLLARDDFVQLIERWFDWKHSINDFLGIVRDFPGVLELLPWPGEDGLASDGVDYFDAQLWESWHEEDRDRARKNNAWVKPRNASLQRARSTIARLGDAALDPDCTLYVAGRGTTPVSLRVREGRIEIGSVEEGDGRVPWRTGIPENVPVWYTDASHGDLASHKRAFQGYKSLLETGDVQDTALQHLPPATRGSGAPVYRVRGLEGHALYPTVDEVLAAATGSSFRVLTPAAAEAEPVTIHVTHGSLAGADSVILIGSYANDSVRGSAEFVDQLMGGQLQQANSLGHYPDNPGEAMFFLNPMQGARPGGAVVIGLGPVGQLTPGELTLALTSGMLEWVRNKEQLGASDTERTGTELAAIMVGSGFAGLSIEAGVQSLVDALCLVQKRLRKANLSASLKRLTLFEENEARALTLAHTLRNLVQAEDLRGRVAYDGRLHTGSGGYRGRSDASSGNSDSVRAIIVGDRRGNLKFTVISDRARNEVWKQGCQYQLIARLLDALIQTSYDNPGLSKVIFEILIPNELKSALTKLHSLVVSVDADAASIPWEMMRDPESDDQRPLVTRLEFVRQLASPRGRGRVPTVMESRALVIGDTLSGMEPLPGAVNEAKAVASLFDQHGYLVNPLYQAGSVQILEGLFTAHYRFVHLAGHGVVDPDDPCGTGMVLEPGVVLSPHQIAQLRHVPEFVFINCCHLGSTREDARQPWYQLAANLATEFIEMGCKAVIAAGWAVDDAAANTFADSFYRQMFEGSTFGAALKIARRKTYEQHSQTNTWGAYQAYGDDRYRFQRKGSFRFDWDYVSASDLSADLDIICARLQCSQTREKQDYYQELLKALEARAQTHGFHNCELSELFAQAWAQLGKRERAIQYYRHILQMEDGRVSIKSLEQLANLEVRHGGALLNEEDEELRKEGENFMEQGLKRLELLLQIGETSERQSLLGSYWKRKAQAEGQKAGRKTSQIVKCLKSMREAYGRAAELANQRTGLWDYYPLFNALDINWLEAARSGKSLADLETDTSLFSHLPSGVEDGRRRFLEDRGFFHGLAEIEAQRIDACWACCNGRTDGRITNPVVLRQLIVAYQTYRRRLGSTGEWDSVTNHLQFLRDMLPDREEAGAIKQALVKLAEGIRHTG